MFDLVDKVHEIQNNQKLKKIIKNAFDEYNNKFTEEMVVKQYISFLKNCKINVWNSSYFYLKK